MSNTGPISYLNTTERSHYDSDPWSNVGTSQGGGMYGGDYQTYEYQVLLPYIQNLKTQMATLQAGTALYQQYQNYLTTAQGYLQQVDPQMACDPSMGGNWDPLSSPFGGFGSSSQYPSFNPIDPNSDPNAAPGDPSSPQGSAYSSPPDYQDTNKIVFETGTDWTWNASLNDGTDSRTPYVYTNNAKVIVNDSGAQVHVTQQIDPDSQKPMKVVTITYPNGVTKTANILGQNLTVQAANQKNVTLDASVTSGVTVTDVGKDTTPQGDQPDTTDDTTRTWTSKDTVNYFVTQGTETDQIYATTVNFTLPDRTDTAKVTKLGPNEYTVEVYDSTGTNLIRTAHLYQVKSLNFSCLDAANMTYADQTSSGAGTTPETWSDPKCKGDPQITVNGQSGGALAGPLNITSDGASDTVPSSFSADGSAANYDKGGDVSLHTYYDDTVTGANISSDGNVDIYPSGANDTAEVAYDGKLVVITIHKEGQSSPTEIFNVDAAMMKKLTLHIATANINYDTNFVLPGDIQKKIFDASGNDASTVIQGNALTKIDLFSNYIKDGKYTAAEILDMMKTHHLSVDDFDQSQLSIPPSDNMIAFLEDLDSKLKGYLKNTDLLTSDADNYKNRENARDQLVEDLKQVGYGTLVSKYNMSDSNPLRDLMTYSQENGKMIIGGHIYDIFDDSGDVNFSKWKFDNSIPYQPRDPKTGDVKDANIWVWYDDQTGYWNCWGCTQAQAQDALNKHYDYYGSGNSQYFEPQGTKGYSPTDPTSWVGDGRDANAL